VEKDLQITAMDCLVLPQSSKSKCNKAIVNNCELWQQQLRHLNYHDLIKIANKEVIKHLPKITKIEKGVYRPCQLGKQTRAAHKKTFGIAAELNSIWTINRVLAKFEELSGLKANPSKNSFFCSGV
jgi:hypothetical protein